MEKAPPVDRYESVYVALGKLSLSKQRFPK